jgi:hypothetical protein
MDHLLSTPPLSGAASYGDTVDSGLTEMAAPTLARHALWYKIKRIVRAIFAPGDVEGEDISFDWYSTTEVSEYFDATRDPQAFDAVDDKTYRELDGTSYARLLLQDRSIFARQFFEQRFRCGAEPEEAHSFAERVLLLSKDDLAMDAIRASVKPLLKAQQEVASILFRPDAIVLPAMFARLRRLDILGVGLCCVLAVWPTVAALSVLLAYIAFSLYVQVRCYRFLKVWTNKRSALQKLVATALNIQERRSSVPKELLPPILLERARLEKVAGAIEAGMLAKSSITAEYANLFFLYEYARASTECRSLKAHLTELKDIYYAVSRLELQLAIAQRVRAGLVICQPTESPDSRVSFDQLVHPLLPTPSSLGFENHGRSLFISGQNGIGKSTLLRALGLSVCAYRAFGYAHSQDAVLPRAVVWSSMQVDDSIEQGRSLYMSELARASRLLDAGRSTMPVVFLVDELFRGTNYLESVAASASVLHSLAQRNIVFATSHNVVLATLLREDLDPVRLVHGETPGLKLESGVLVTTNGVELMKAYQFDSSVIARAAAIANWYSDYIAHPENSSRDLFSD